MNIVTKDKIIKILSSRSCEVIGIDGGDGSGKSTLSNEIKNATGIEVIHLDDILNKEKSAFASEIKYDELDAAMINHQGALIIEGCCLLDVLERADIKADINIYVKRTHLSLWADEDDYEIEGNIDNALEERNENSRKMSEYFASSEGKEFDATETDFLSGFRREIIKYHFKYRPHKKADYILERSENS